MAHTYSVVGNINEHALTIGETTFGGLKDLAKQPGAIMDYGSLIWVTLQRAKTASEAITIMDKLVQEFGYASDGESFTLPMPMGLARHASSAGVERASRESGARAKLGRGRAVSQQNARAGRVADTTKPK